MPKEDGYPSGADPFGSDKLMPGRMTMVFGINRTTVGLLESARGVFKLRGDQDKGASFRFLQCFMERGKKALGQNEFLSVIMADFTASAAGISAALASAYLASFFFEPKMKK